MLEKTKKYQKKIGSYISQLQDGRILGLLLFLAIATLVSWSGVKTIETNYGLQRDIAKLEQQNTVQQLSNENLRLANTYYNTPAYLEIAGRQNFGLAAPGETVWVVPQKVALAHAVDLPEAAKRQSTFAQNNESIYVRHLRAWMDFFMHRDNSDNLTNLKN